MGDLKDYVAQQQRQGYTNEFIRERLRTVGWDEDSIVGAFNQAEELQEDRKWVGYSVFLMLGVVALTFGVVEMGDITGFSAASPIHCLVENPEYPGNYDFVNSEEDCMRLIAANMCDPVSERLAVEGSGKVMFEASAACEGRYGNVYIS